MNYADELTNRGIEFREADEGQVMINCPFHSDNNPSLTVNVNEGVFHCFSCKESGPFVKLLAQLEDISLEEARRQMKEGQDDDSLMADIQRKLDEALSEEEDPMNTRTYSTKAFHAFFPKVSTPGLKYLKGRGISRKTATKFDIRWGEEGVMEGRVVFPIYTPEGGLWSYGGRTIHKDVKPKTRKVRSALQELYGLYELLKEASGRLPYLIVTEGEFDAMYLQELGYNAVSTMGTAALTDGQLYRLKKYAKLVVWSYDGDNAGRRAQKKAAETTKRHMPTVGVALPEGKDPNELTAAEAEKLYGGFL